MPVTNATKTLPHLYVPECVFDLPCKQINNKVQRYNATNFNLQGTLCFTTLGVGVMGMLMFAGLLVALFLILRVMRARRREKVAIARAFAAIEAGTSPQAWLSMLNET